LAAEQVRVGNTNVQDEVQFAGAPFPSLNVNALVLATLFPDAEPDLGVKDKESAAVKFKKAPTGPEGQDLRCVIASDDTIRVEHLFPPQAVDELAGNIPRTRATQLRLLEELSKAYEYTGEPAVYARKWSVVTQGVPCVPWLTQQCHLKSGDMGAERFAPAGSVVRLRVIGMQVVLQISPPGTDSLTKELRQKLEVASPFSINVSSIEDWDAGVAAVTGILRGGAEPGLYVEFLRAVSQAHR